MADALQQDDPLTPAKPLAGGVAMPAYLTGAAPAKPTPENPPAPTAKLKPDAQDAAQQPRAGKSATTPQAHAAAGDASAMIQHFEGFRDQPYWDVNHWRVGFGSDTATRADGSVEPVTSMTRVTPEDAQRDLTRRIGIYQGTIQSTLGPEAWARLSPQAQAAMTSVAYNYGHVPPHVLAAAKTGDPQQLAQAIAALPANSSRRQQEAGAILGTFGISGPTAVHGGGARNYAMPAGTEGASYLPVNSQQSEAAKPAEEKKAPSWDDLDKLEAKKQPSWDDLDNLEGAKKVSSEVGTEGKGFVGRMYDKLAGFATGGDKLSAEGRKRAEENPDERAAGLENMANPGATSVYQPTAAARAVETGEYKGLASGVAQDVTGAAELLPNTLGGGLAAQGTDYLKSVGDPSAQAVGQGLGYLGGGEALGALRGGAAATEASEATLGSLGKNMAKSVGTGAAIGAATPVGSEGRKGREKGYGERLIEKAPYAMGGGLLGTVPPLVGAGKMAWGKKSDLFQAAHGPEAEEGAAAAKAAVKGHTERFAEGEAAKAAEVARAEKELEREIPGINADLKQAQKDAAKAGMNEQLVGRHVELKKQELVQAHQSAASVAAEVAARPRMTTEDFTNLVHETAKKDAAAVRERIATESGFSEAVNADGGKPSIPTKTFVAKAKALARETKSDDLSAEMASFANKLETDGARAVSIKGARQIMSDMDAKIDSLSGDAKHDLVALKNEFQKHVETVHPGLAEARRKYAELSRENDVYERSGALAKSVKDDPYSHEPVVDKTKLVGALFNQTGKGADALKRLASLPGSEVKEAGEKFLYGKLLGENAGKEPTVAQFNAFRDKNSLAIDRLGLKNQFADTSSAMKAANDSVEAAKIAEKAAGQSEKEAKTLTARKEAAAKATESRGESVQSSVSELATKRQAHEETAKDYQNLVKILDTKEPHEIAKEAKTFAERSLKNGLISDKDFAEMTEQAKALDKQFESKREALQAIATYKSFVTRTLATGLTGGLGLGYLRNIPTGH